MKIDIPALKQAANAALVADEMSDMARANTLAKYQAATNPATVLALIERVERADEKIKYLRQTAVTWRYSYRRQHERAEAAEAENKRLREALGACDKYLERVEGQGEGGIASFNILRQSVRAALVRP